MDDGRLHRSGLRIIDGGLAGLTQSKVECEASACASGATAPGPSLTWARGDAWPLGEPIELRRHGRIVAVLYLPVSVVLDERRRTLIEQALEL